MTSEDSRGENTELDSIRLNGNYGTGLQPGTGLKTLNLFPHQLLLYLLEPLSFNLI